MSGLNLPKPTSFDDLNGKYHVNKYFEKGGPVDLLAEYGSDLFSYDAEKGVTMTATVVVINDVAPLKAQGDSIIRPYANENFGVKLSADKKHLYIWDGVKNDVASDPIALQKNEGNGGGTGSSGCDAGFGIFALLAMGGAIALVSRKK